MYVGDDGCKLLAENERIPNCQFYNQDKSCLKCVKDMAVENNLCVKAVAQNCLEYRSKIACSKCGENYGLKETDSILNCVAKNKSHCTVSKDLFPFDCLICGNNFYPNATGECVEITKSVTRCI